MYRGPCSLAILGIICVAGCGQSSTNGVSESVPGRSTSAANKVPAIAVADEQLPAPAFQALLVCFNNADGSGSNCSSSMGGLKVVTSTMRCGFNGAVSEITWTYRGQKDGKDLYHIVRKFPLDSAMDLSHLDSNDAKTTEMDVIFDGNRQVLFKDQSQCIVIELQSEKKEAEADAASGRASLKS